MKLLQRLPGRHHLRALGWTGHIDPDLNFIIKSATARLVLDSRKALHSGTLHRQQGHHADTEQQRDERDDFVSNQAGDAATQARLRPRLIEGIPCSPDIFRMYLEHENLLFAAS